MKRLILLVVLVVVGQFVIVPMIKSDIESHHVDVVCKRLGDQC